MGAGRVTRDEIVKRPFVRAETAFPLRPLEQLFGDLQLNHCRPQPIQLVSVADRTAPFAPEPSEQRPPVGPVASRLASRTAIVAPAPRCARRGVNSDGNQFSLSVLNRPVFVP